MTNLKKSVLGVILACVLAAGAAFFTRSKDADSSPSGLRRAPSFEITGGDGKKLSLEGWKDHVIVVHFWASWCGPCIPEMPEILAAAKRLPKDRDGRAVYWLLVSQDPSWEKAHSVVKEDALPENVFLALDSEAKLSDAFGSYQFPETYLVTRKGELAAKWIGAQEWGGAWGEQALTGIESVSRTGKPPNSGS